MMCVQLERAFATMVDRELTACTRALFDEMYKMTPVEIEFFVARKLLAANLRFSFETLLEQNSWFDYFLLRPIVISFFRSVPFRPVIFHKVGAHATR